jgi:two-component system, OmpR family, sensor kinase
VIRWWPRRLSSLYARAIAVLVLAVLVSHALSMALYHFEFVERLTESQEERLAEKLEAMKHLLESAPEDAREAIAHTIGGATIEAHWHRQNAIAQTPDEDEYARSVAARLTERLAGIGVDDIRVATGAAPDSAAQPRLLLVSMRLSDGTWVNASSGVYHAPGGGLKSALLSTILMALAVVPVGIWLLRLAIRPLRVFSEAADRLGRDVHAPPIPESGPAEVAQTARTFNDMQRKIGKLLADRTTMLAAVSHDLRTPLTRLRLRAELVDDVEQQAKIVADIVEMEAMVDSTLAFFRDDAVAEAKRPIEFASFVRTVVNEWADFGHEVVLLDCVPCAIEGRPVALKRALVNLIENATKYGDRARVSLVRLTDEAVLTIDDDGPGVPRERLEDVFEPFVRLETSRSRTTGGVGLGLALARGVVRSHGGSVALENLDGRGLRATVRLPLTAGGAA